MMTALEKLLDTLRKMAPDEREKGLYFEKLIKSYLQHDPKYSFSKVWLWAEWAAEQGKSATDTGIDLVAEELDGGAVWAIQCKFYDAGTKVYKKHIDSFFTESGKKPFAQRLIVLTTSETSKHVHSAMEGQQIPCSTLNLSDLEESPIDWSKYEPTKPIVFRPKKTLRDHQKAALKATKFGLEDADRGKLIMACGTGKTFTALKIAEEMAGMGKQVLFLVPSLALLSQTLTEWTAESETPLRCFAVCSDSATGKNKNDDLADIAPSDLAYPATTDASKLAAKIASFSHPEKMVVVFSTYQSLQVVSDAQKKSGLPDFDLIICDEAHRTTGATLAGEDESNFVRIHDQGFIKGNKRIYMTATPRVFGDAVKAKANESDALLCSMDDTSLFGEVLYCINFSEAVKLGLLSDYKVLVLAVDEAHISLSVQKHLQDADNELVLDDATKIIGCWKALAKEQLSEDLSDDVANVMHRAVAFCRDIKTSQRMEKFFPSVVAEYAESEGLPENALRCEVGHVDGTMNATERKSHLDWLKADTLAEGDVCRILTNARCLSEGVDVPSLDAILFLNPRKSQIDVVQSVGRVMRRAEGKKRGYVILPIGVPANLTPEQALADNEKYKVVWQVLQALRSHDDEFDATVNKIDLGVDVSSKMEVIAVTNTFKQKQTSDGGNGNTVGRGGDNNSENESGGNSIPKPVQHTIDFQVGDFEKAIYAKIVKKVGNRQHWEEWASDIASIAQKHISRITGLLQNHSGPEYTAFNGFLTEIHDDLNDSITEAEAIEMLAQHLITKPVFDALFDGYSFAENNPVSQAMTKVLDALNEHNFGKEAESLEKFYASVKQRASGIDNAEGKQKIIVELYDKFFANAFPKLKDKLGIVYTPVPVVDFILHSVNDVLQQEFGQTLGSDNVHILDPFTGTGTFVTRLLQSGLLTPEQIVEKYAGQIHANEIVLLAYYIAAINIESAYHDIVGGDYKPFEGICLTDTFQLYEKDDLVSEVLVDNSNRRQKQKALNIRVVVGNPPYSVGQKSENDNNDNVEYPHLDTRIRDTYAKRSNAILAKGLYDSYIRAIRWASDRIGDCGVIGFVTNAGFLEANTADGLRKCLAEDFSCLYVFHLRGNQRTQGEMSRKEGGKIFGGGSRAPIAISILVKNPSAAEYGQIRFHDIGDYLSRDEKLSKISDFGSVAGISAAGAWQNIIPDQYGDWLKQRDENFGCYIVLGDKKGNATKLFENFSLGVVTNRDAWCYNHSKQAVAKNMAGMIEFYNSELVRFNGAHDGLDKKAREAKVDNFIDANPAKISWTRSLKQEITKGRIHAFQQHDLTPSLYRPFTKQWLYYNRRFNEMVYQMPRIFPSQAAENLVVCVSGIGARSFSVLITDTLPCLDNIEKGQCFPLYLYETLESSEPDGLAQQTDMFNAAASQAVGPVRRDAMTDEGLVHFKQAYPSEAIGKDDVFYYIYGLLHSEGYRERYADNLGKELPRIPRVKTAADFWAFSKAGRSLAKLHLDYETVEKYPLEIKGGGLLLNDTDYRVEKMKYGKAGKDKDLTTLHYNSKITLTGIPLEAYEYVVNGKPALDWVVERQCVKTDKDSGIVNDANLWATETMNNPKYPLELFQRVIMVSLETMKIVHALPELVIYPSDKPPAPNLK